MGCPVPRIVSRSAGRIRYAADPPAAASAFKAGDTENLRFDVGAFDGISSTFDVMFASRPEAAAGELARIGRPAGRIALAMRKDEGDLAKTFGVMRPYMPPPSRAARPARGRRSTLDCKR